MREMSTFRHNNDISNEFYQTSPGLVDILLKILKKHHKTGYVCIDPCVGKGAIYKNLPNPSIGVDVSSKYLKKDNKYIVADFLNWKPKQTSTNIIVVGNPPFYSKDGENLVVKFLNHSACFCKKVLFIVPLHMNRPSNIRKVKNLKLTNVYYLPSKHQVFEKEDSTRKKVGVCIQLWEKGAPQPQRERKVPILTNDFSMHSNISSHKFDFYVYWLGRINKIGEISKKYPCDTTTPYSRSWRGVKVLNKRKLGDIKKRFDQMKKKDEYKKKLINTSNGYWYISIPEIYELFYKISSNKANYKEHYFTS